METWLFHPLIKIVDLFLLCTFHYYMSIYSMKILYGGLSVRLQRQKYKNMKKRYSRLQIKIYDWFFFCIQSSHVSVYSKNILSVCLTVRVYKKYLCRANTDSWFFYEIVFLINLLFIITYDILFTVLLFLFGLSVFFLQTLRCLWCCHHFFLCRYW